MTEQEIESRILVCEMKERDYLEAGNTKTADRYSNEKHKWEKLLNKLDPKRDEQLADYKKGYRILEQALNKVKDKLICYGEVLDSTSCQQLQKECLQIIDNVLGEEKC